MYNLPPDPPAAPSDGAKTSDFEVAAASAAEASLTGGSPTADAVADSLQSLDIGHKDGGEMAASPVVADGEEEKRVLTREEEIEEALACPCLDAMRDGSCGDVFISAYRCFLESETEPQGMECVDAFGAMQGCMAEHPEEYGLDDEAPEGGDGSKDGVEVEVSAADAVSSADDVVGALNVAERDDARAAGSSAEAEMVADAAASVTEDMADVAASVTEDVADAVVGVAADMADAMDDVVGGDEDARAAAGKVTEEERGEDALRAASA